MKKVKDYVKIDLPILRENTPMYEIINIFSNSFHNICPVVDKENKFIGIVSLEEIIDGLLFSNEEASFLEKLPFLANFFEETIENASYVSPLVVAKDIMHRDVIFVREDDSMIKAAISIKKNNIHRLIVVDSKHKPIGYISRNEICKAFLGQT